MAVALSSFFILQVFISLHSSPLYLNTLEYHHINSHLYEPQSFVMGFQFGLPHIFGLGTLVAFIVSKTSTYSLLEVLPWVYLTTIPLYVLICSSFIYQFFLSPNYDMFPPFQHSRCGANSSKSSPPNVECLSENGIRSMDLSFDTSSPSKLNVLR